MDERVSYGIGEGLAFVAPGRALLLDRSFNDDSPEQLWAAVSSADGVDEIIDALRSIGLRRLGSFALTLIGVEKTHVVVRGGGRALVSTGEATDEAQATPGAVTWSEFAYDGVRLVELHLGAGSSGSGFPCSSGVVHASWVRLELTVPFEKSVVRSWKPLTDPAPDDLSESVVDAGELTLSGLAEDQSHNTLSSLEGVDAHASIGSSELGTTDSSEAPTPGEDDDFDDLFGATRFRAVEAAAIRNEEDADIASDESDGAEPEGAVDLGPESPAFFPQTSPPKPSTSQSAPPDAAAGQLIDGVPDLSSPASAPPPVTEVVEPLPSVPSPPTDVTGPLTSAAGLEDDDPENFTISRSQLQKMKESAQRRRDEPTVHGVHCERNHPNPPQATHCRLCGAELSQLEPVTIPRPVLGVLRFSNGTEAILDRPAVIGRSPRAERVNSKELPQLVTLPSPDQNISRNHLEIRLDGWHVLVVDLDSVNGTLVTNPGEAPLLLRSGEEVPIVVGSLVTIADEITFVYEVGSE
jgi:FHA domain